MTPTRRRLLAALAGTGAVGSAGCLDRPAVLGGSDAEPSSDFDLGSAQVDLGVSCDENEGEIDLSGGRRPADVDGAQATPESSYDDGEIPLRDEPLSLGHERSAFVEGDQSGGVGHDGIPSVDEPRFAPAADVSMPPCERVFGVSIDGDVRAYPQRILVRHEIANDVVGGEPVGVTYCPLTGTAQGFYRGGTELGVSGRLVNSNLILWDRSFDVRWPQVAATATEARDRGGREGGSEFVGQSLREFRIVWTTWGRWSDRHPDTLVMTEETGFARSYNRDPYGSYTPVSGHYAIDRPRSPNFPLLVEPELDEKRVVIGARTSEGAIAFDKLTLLRESVLTGSIGETPVVAVADDGLATGYIYSNPDGVGVSATADGYEVDGETAAAGALPLERIVALDAMWFAWHGYYPDGERVGL